MNISLFLTLTFTSFTSFSSYSIEKAIDTSGTGNKTTKNVKENLQKVHKDKFHPIFFAVLQITAQGKNVN